MGDPKAGLTALRAEMDAADRDLLAAIAARRAVSRRMAAFKTAEGLPFRDEARETELLARLVRDGAAAGLPAELIESLYRFLLRDSLEIQEATGRAT